MGVNVMLYARVLLNRMIFWKYAKNLILCCVKNTRFLYVAPSIVTTVNYILFMFYLNQHSAAGTISSLTSSLSCYVELSCRFFIHIPSVFIKPHILATIMAIAMGKQFYRNLCLGSMCCIRNFPVVQLVRLEIIVGKLQFRQIRCINSKILFVLLLRRHHNPMRNFAPLFDVTKPALPPHFYFQDFFIMIFNIPK